MRAYFVVFVLLFAIFGSIAAYLYQRFSALSEMDFSPPPVTIAVAQAAVQTWAQHLEAVGTIRSARGIDLSTETSGEIAELHFDSGDRVKAGDLLLVLDDEVERANRKNEIASVDLAKILFDRDSRLIKQQSIPQSQYDRSRADLEMARARLAETEARLRNKRIYAPFDGQLGIRQVEVGDYVTPGTFIVTLQDRSELEIDFTLPGRNAPLLKTGQHAELSVAAYPGRTFNAELVAVDARIDPATRNLLLRAKILDAADLLPGMFANLRLDVSNSSELVTVPETAVSYALQGNIVYVVIPQEEGEPIAVSRVVRVGRAEGDKVAILDGVEDGETVVTAGQNKLYRGVRVLIDDTTQF